MNTAAEALPSEVERTTTRWRWLVLGVVLVLATVARIWVISHFPDPDGDAKGHFGIATALLADPLSVSAHWVWPPGYHYFLAGLIALGFTAQGVRLLDGTLAALLPVLVWLYAERTLEPRASDPTRLVPFLAALFCAAMPIVNLQGTSAEPETVFTFLVLASAWAIDRGRFAVGGWALAGACMVRYEAWGAVGLLAGLRLLGFFPVLVRRLPGFVARACRLPVVVVAPAVVVTAAWFVAHRIAHGAWFGFVQEIFRYTHAQRVTFRQDAWNEVLWFPVMVPWYLFGLTLPLAALGVRRAWRNGFALPLGLYLFLLASYAFQAALGSARYYLSLTPFVCIAAAYGASALSERWRWALPPVVAVTVAHLVRLLLLNLRWTFHL